MIEELHRRFLAALAADPAPRSDVARFSHVASGGAAALMYVDGSTTLGEVPGTIEGLPFKACKAILDEQKLHAINFRYTRTDAWRGGYELETAEQARTFDEGRAHLDEAILAALRRRLGQGITNAGILYGVQGWKHRDPKLKLRRGMKGEFWDLPDDLRALWDSLRAHLATAGIANLYYVWYFVEKKDRGIQLSYDRLA